MQLDDEYARGYMLPGERLLFGEKVVSRGVFRAIMVLCGVMGPIGLVATAVGLAGFAGPSPLALGIPFLVTAVVLAGLSVLFSVFRSMVTSSHLQVHFGWAKRKVPLEAIERIAVVPYVGARQGKVSMGFDGVVRTWVGTPNHGRGVEVSYQVGERKHVLTIGSDDVERFASVLEQARAAVIRGDADPARLRTGAVRVVGADGDSEAEAEQALVGGAPEPLRVRADD